MHIYTAFLNPKIPGLENGPGIATPGTIFQSLDFGIEECQSRDPGIGN